jgi:aldehyde dehydrogenase (NAD+)
VLDDADLDIAVDGCLWATFLRTTASRVKVARASFVPASIYDTFMERLLDRAASRSVCLKTAALTWVQ